MKLVETDFMAVQQRTTADKEKQLKQVFENYFALCPMCTIRYALVSQKNV